VHVAGRENVTDVWIAGERVVDRRSITLLDEAVITTRARAWQQRLQP